MTHCGMQSSMYHQFPFSPPPSGFTITDPKKRADALWERHLKGDKVYGATSNIVFLLSKVQMQEAQNSLETKTEIRVYLFFVFFLI